jgi:hypothetical protein
VEGNDWLLKKNKKINKLLCDMLHVPKFCIHFKTCLSDKSFHFSTLFHTETFLAHKIKSYDGTTSCTSDFQVHLLPQSNIHQDIKLSTTNESLIIIFKSK